MLVTGRGAVLEHLEFHRVRVKAGIDAFLCYGDGGRMTNNVNTRSVVRRLFNPIYILGGQFEPWLFSGSRVISAR